MAKRKTFPKMIWVKMEKDGDETYLLADDDDEGLVSTGETVELGVYQLKEKHKVRGTVVAVSRN